MIDQTELQDELEAFCSIREAEQFYGHSNPESLEGGSQRIDSCRAIKEEECCAHLLISADTFQASVAREAVAAGADIVNDVSGGLLDPGMYPTVAFFLTHSSI